MTKVSLLAGGDYSPPQGDFDVNIGVERGALTLLENGFARDWAVGYFDYNSSDELAKLKWSGAIIHQ
ncbi:hypothetical protein [Streptococcus pluranimalium]